MERDSEIAFDSRKQDRSLVSMFVDMSKAILQNTLSARRAEMSEYQSEQNWSMVTNMRDMQKTKSYHSNQLWFSVRKQILA